MEYKNTYIITCAGKGSGHFFAKSVEKLGANVALISRIESDIQDNYQRMNQAEAHFHYFIIQMNALI